MPEVARGISSPAETSATAAASRNSDAGGGADPGPREREHFLAALGHLSDNEEAFTESLYAHFFALRPDAAALFGEYSISEKEEMVRETFRSLLAWLEQEPWLDANLTALGQSHAEYGVEGDMYPPFVEALLESAEEVSERPIAASTLGLLRQATEEIVAKMRAAGGA